MWHHSRSGEAIYGRQIRHKYVSQSQIVHTLQRLGHPSHYFVNNYKILLWQGQITARQQSITFLHSHKAKLSTLKNVVLWGCCSAHGSKTEGIFTIQIEDYTALSIRYSNEIPVQKFNSLELAREIRKFAYPTKSQAKKIIWRSWSSQVSCHY